MLVDSSLQWQHISKMPSMFFFEVWKQKSNVTRSRLCHGWLVFSKPHHVITYGNTGLVGRHCSRTRRHLIIFHVPFFSLQSLPNIFLEWFLLNLIYKQNSYELQKMVAITFPADYWTSFRLFLYKATASTSCFISGS